MKKMRYSPLTKLFRFGLSVMEKKISRYGRTNGRTNELTDGNCFFKVGMTKRPKPKSLVNRLYLILIFE